jgi:hypothetical protein
MPLYSFRPLANGLHTDHPVPDLPFVDDSHIPVEDPEAIEATGRHPGTDMWGRFDPVRRFGGWVAFTTDPIRHDLGWVVRWHPDHGRSVLLYRDDDVASVYEDFQGPALLFRAGGYWWDGATWYRPDQVWDAAGEDYYHRQVPAAAIVTAADMLATAAAAADRGRVLTIGAAKPDMTPSGRWRDDLARWARERPAGSLRDSVVNLTAPELAADQMVGAAELAGIGGIAASTLRAYIARGEAEVPAPQASPNGRSLWARPVAEDWAEARQRSPEGITLAVSAERDGGRPPGLDDLWSRFSGWFYTRLWERPAVRKRWALRWRTETAVREVADDLGWLVASSLDRIIPVQALSFTIQRAVLDELAEGQQLHRDDSDPAYYGINRKVAVMLSWLIRHDPARAASAIGAITGEAERRRIPRKVTERSIRVALSLDSNLDADSQREFLSRVLTPATTTQPPEGTR